MGVRIASSSSTTALNATIANAVEGLISTTGAIGLVQDNAQVLLNLFVNFTVGAAATSVTFKIRRGAALTSTQVGVTASMNVTASTNVFYAYSYVDSPGIVAGLQYSLTGLVTGGAAVLTILDTCITAIVL